MKAESTVAVMPIISSPDIVRSSSRRAALFVWVGSLVLLICTIGIAPVNRTQEARVLESAREMLGGGVRGWLIPHANGVVRLQKPPLAYWLSAASYMIFGVSTWSGRLPLALCGWLTVGLTYTIARRELGERAALMSAALLVGSFLFYRHARLAETDVLVTLLVTAAIYSIQFGVSQDRLHWFAVSGLATGLAAVAKGAPAVFPILFLIGMMIVTRRWQVGLRWVLSGAPVIALIVGGAWWLYAWRLPEFQVIGREVGALIDEPNHPGLFYVYFPELLKATMPWSPIALLAIVTGIVQWRRDARVRSLLVWCAAIFLPLCVTANKQDHYLLPMMPPLAMLAGWWLNSLSESEQPGFAHHVTNLVIFATVVILAIAALALPSLARHARGDILSTDLVMAAALLGGTLILWFVMRRRTRAGRFVVFSIAMALILTVTLGFWAPTLQTRSPRDVAAEIRSLGGDAYCFYGENLSLPLVFELRQIVPQITSTPELVSLARHRGRNLMVIAQTKADVAPPRLPANFVRVESIETKDQKFEIYRAIK